jgi:ParB family chromosome partitioning protein
MTNPKPSSDTPQSRGVARLVAVSGLPVEVSIEPEDGAEDEVVQTTASLASPDPIAAGVVVRREIAEISEIPLELIRPNPHQPRRSMDQNSLEGLAASIKSTGVIQPIAVRRVGQGYELVAGERRLRAAQLAGLQRVPAIVRSLDSATQAQMALIENIQREDLNPIDRANAYRTLIQDLGLTHSELATRLGEDRSSISNYLRLLDLTESVKILVRDGILSVGHAKLIAGVTDILEQQRLASLVSSQDLSVRNLERIIQQGGRTAPPAKSSPATSPHIADLEKSLSRQLGMKTHIKPARGKGKGRLVIHYASLDQFDELISRLGLQPE